jgi:hypothetical protein
MVRRICGLDTLLAWVCLYNSKSLKLNLYIVIENGHNQACDIAVLVVMITIFFSMVMRKSITTYSFNTLFLIETKQTS